MEPENQFQKQEFSPNQPHQTALPNATAVLVLGIISIVGCACYGLVGIICGVVALTLANKDLKLYNANPALYTPTSYSNTNSGRICAIIGLCLSAVYIVYIIFLIITVGTAILTHPQDVWNSHNL